MTIIFIISGILIVSAGVWHWQKSIQNQPRSPFTERSVNETSNNLPNIPSVEKRIIGKGYQKGYINKTLANGQNKIQQLAFISPEGGEILVPDNIAILIDGALRSQKTRNTEGQDIKSFIMPIDSRNKDIIYLSTAEPLDKSYSLVVNRIYSYNLNTSELKEIFKEKDNNNSPYNPQSSRILRTVGIDGSKIIVLYDDIDNSPGPCYNIWYHAKDYMGYLDLSNLSDGLKPYIVPQYKVDEAKQDSQNCEKELQ